MTVDVVAVPTFFATLWLLERRGPARPFTAQAGWALRGLLFFATTATVGMLVAAGWRLTALAERPLWDGSALGGWGLALGFFAVTLANYWWHRVAHRVHRVWLLTHQLHHSALRVDVASAFMVHPFEVVVKVSIGFVLSRCVLGLSTESAAVIVALTSMLSIFEHWNVKTPRWLGLFIARPEMHCLHHQFGVHARNYGLPLWDLAFGTFENPAEVNVRVGFDPAASARLGELLLGRDVVADSGGPEVSP